MGLRPHAAQLPDFRMPGDVPSSHWLRCPCVCVIRVLTGLAHDSLITSHVDAFLAGSVTLLESPQAHFPVHRPSPFPRTFMTSVSAQVCTQYEITKISGKQGPQWDAFLGIGRYTTNACHKA